MVTLHKKNLKSQRLRKQGMLGNLLERRDESARDASSALASWISPVSLTYARENRPTIEKTLVRLESSELHLGENRPLKPFLSVVVPVLNGQATLKETLESIVGQDQETEIIVVDGGSTDGTLELIQSYKKHLTCWISEKDESMYDGINKGIALCKGEIIKILNADDCLTSHSLSIAKENFVAQGQEHCLRGSMCRTDETTGRVVEIWNAKDKTLTSPSFFPILHPSWYVPKAVYEKHGLYLPYFKIAADQEYFLHLNQEKVSFQFSKEPLVEFRMGGMSASYKGFFETVETNTVYLGRLRTIAMGAETVVKKSRYKIFETLVGKEKAPQRWADFKKQIRKTKEFLR